MQKEFQADWTGERQPFRHTWEGLVNIDQFRWLVRGDVQHQLKMAQEELHARHVRAVGMFDDELRVMGIDPKNFAQPDPSSCRPNYQILDYITDSLLEIGVRPMITTTFIPGCMASGEHTVFTTKGRTDLPKSMLEWENFVRQYVCHIAERYGVEEVEQWYFEVWNEPNLFPFFAGTQADFFTLWQHTYRAVKSVCPQFRIGGPSTARAEWIEDFVRWTREQQCPPDYLTVHIYNKDSEDEALSPFDGAQEAKTNRRADYAAEVMRGVRELADRLSFAGEIHWNEWGRSWWICDPDRETANEAGYIVKTMCEVSQYADRFAYWCLSDVYDQGGYGAEAFHGNYGMLSLNSLRKPSYHAFSLLSMTGTERVEVSGSSPDRCIGAAAVCGENEYEFLYYQYAPGEDGGMEQEVCFNLPVDAEIKNAVVYLVDADHNNAPAAWRAMGSPQYPTPAQVEALRVENMLMPSGKLKISEGKGIFSISGAGAALVLLPKKKGD